MMLRKAEVFGISDPKLFVDNLLEFKENEEDRWMHKSNFLSFCLQRINLDLKKSLLEKDARIESLEKEFQALKRRLGNL